MKNLPIVFFLLLVNLQVNSQQTWTNYTGGGNFYDIEVDGNDVWIGSQGGLTKTNLETGEFETFLAGNSPIKGGGITEIEKAPDGSFWFGSENAGIFHYKNGEWTNYYEGITEDSYDKITNLQVLPNGDVWFFVYKGNQKNYLFRIREGVVKYFPNIPDGQKSFCAVDENTIYIAYNQAIYKYVVVQEAIVETLHADNSIILPDDQFSQIVADKNGAVIISSATRILKLENGNLTVLEDIGLFGYKTFSDDDGNVYLQPYLNDPNDIRLMKYDGNGITYFKDEDFQPYPLDRTPIFYNADAEGGLYAAFYGFSSGKTIYRFYENEWTPVESEIFPILSNYQRNVQSDCDGNIWFTNLLGLDVRHSDGTWKNYNFVSGESGYFHSDDMTVDPVTCDVWFANRSNSGNAMIPGIVKISNGEVTNFLYDHANVESIEATVDGRVYFYSAKSGFGYIIDDEVHLIDGLQPYASVYSMDSDSEGNIYLASWDLGLVKYDGEYFDYIGSGEGSDRAYRVYIDNDDFAWIDTPNGLMEYDGVNWYSFEEFEFYKDVYGMVQDKKGNFWISTWTDGLYYWDKESFQNYNIHNSDLTTDNLRHLSLDVEGNLIVSQHVGASVLSIPNTQRNYKGKGTVFYDSDKNGLYEEGLDVLVPSQKVKASGLDTWSITNPSGEYTFYSDEPNEHSFQHQLEESAVSTTDNPQQTILNDIKVDLPAFGYWKEVEEDVQMTISNGVPVCNRDFKVYINIRNKDIGEVQGNLVLKHDNFLTILDSSIPISQQSDEEIIFENIVLGSLKGRSIQIDVEAPGIDVEETTLFFTATFETSDNQFFANTTDQVLCSYDPNDKKVEATGEFKDDFGLIKDPIKYTIRFQNEGTYKAFDIIVTDTLDSDLDPSTFELLASSHRVETTISEEGVVNFNFPNIDLPHKDEDDLGSQGFVSFTVKPYSDTENFVQIHNTASIYFDFNPAIVTNTTEWNVVDDLSLLSTHEIESQIQVYPNPSDGLFNIHIEENSVYRILDVSGRLVDKGIFNVGINSINLGDKTGIYLLHVSREDGVGSTKKLVVY